MKRLPRFKFNIETLERKNTIRENAKLLAEANKGYGFFNGECKKYEALYDFLCFFLPQFKQRYFDEIIPFNELATCINNFRQNKIKEAPRAKIPEDVLYHGNDQTHLFTIIAIYYEFNSNFNFSKAKVKTRPEFEFIWNINGENKDFKIEQSKRKEFTKREIGYGRVFQEETSKKHDIKTIDFYNEDYPGEGYEEFEESDNEKSDESENFFEKFSDISLGNVFEEVKIIDKSKEKRRQKTQMKFKK